MSAEISQRRLRQPSAHALSANVSRATLSQRSIASTGSQHLPENHAV